MTGTMQQLRGFQLAGSDGESGKVREFYFGDEHWKVPYLVGRTGSWINERDVLVAHALIGFWIFRGTVHAARDWESGGWG